jgi:hypothetical protein
MGQQGMSQAPEMLPFPDEEQSQYLSQFLPLKPGILSTVRLFRSF